MPDELTPNQRVRIEAWLATKSIDELREIVRDLQRFEHMQEELECMPIEELRAMALKAN